MKEKQEYGTNISALFRSFINQHCEISWKRCELIGELFDTQVQQLDWLSTDNGTTFSKSFIPELKDKT